jgi:hypothetical protein
MARRLEDIEARIAEVEKHRLADDEKEKRLLGAAEDFYVKQEKLEITGLGSFLDRMKVPHDDFVGFFKAQEKEAKQRVEKVTPLLQLSGKELEYYRHVERGVIQINPCLWVRSSPGWMCVYNAASCGWTPVVTANASGTCTCDLALNELNPRVEAYGQSSNGWRSAYVHSWLYYDIPARPSTANVTVWIYVPVHGFYVVRKAGFGFSLFSLTIEVEGFQYGFPWGKATKVCVSVSGDNMGRYDANEYMNFVMPTGADSFVVRVSAKLRAIAKSGGSIAVGDFGTGAGNYIKNWWVNTHSPD